MSWDCDELPDEKNPKVFRRAHMEPEEPKHQSPRDRKKCKRNKGEPHDMVLVKDQPQTYYDYRVFYVPGYRVTERRPFRNFDREWRCSHCNKKEVSYTWDQPRNYLGDWEEFRRREVKDK
ncbi:hypothetical protein [Mycobacteroides abscessus]